MKRLLIIVSVLIVLLVGFWIGLGTFIRSDGFRTWLGRRVSQSLRAEGSFERLSWSGATFRSAGFQAIGQPGSKFSSVRLTGVMAHLDWPKLLAGQIVLDSVMVDRAEVQFLPTKPAPPSSSVSIPRQPAPQPRFRIHFSVRQVTVNHTFVAYESRGGAKGGLDDVGVNAVKTGPDAWELVASGGTIRSDWFPSAQLMKAEASLSSHRLRLHPIELASPEGATATIQGEVQLNRGLSSDLGANLAGIPLAKLPTGKEKLDGTVDATLAFQGDLNHFERGTIQGEFQARKVRYDLASHLGAFRFLARSGFLGGADFDSVSGHVLYSDHHFLFTNISAVYRDALRVTGMVEVTGDQLQGLLEVGLKPEFLDWVPGSLEAVFTDERDGLHWTSVRLSGTVQEPREDLSKRLLNAMQDRLGRDLKNQLKDTTKTLRELLKH